MLYFNKKKTSELKVEAGEDLPAVRYVKELIVVGIKDKLKEVIIECKDDMAANPRVGIPAKYVEARNRLAVMTDVISPWNQHGIQKGMVKVSLDNILYEIDVVMDLDKNSIVLQFKKDG